MTIKESLFTQDKCIMRSQGNICQTTTELLESELFKRVLKKFIKRLDEKESLLLDIFEDGVMSGIKTDYLLKTLRLLATKNTEEVNEELPESVEFLRDTYVLANFVEELYNYWRNFNRFLVHDEEDNEKSPTSELGPYMTFNQTVEQLSHMVRATYRDVKYNITGQKPRIYRQVRAGSQVGLITVKKDWPCPEGAYSVLKNIPMIRQIHLNPPLIFNPPMNTRTGSFQKVDTNPLESWEPSVEKWACYPAKVGPLLIHIYFHQKFMELGVSLANLFELADGESLTKQPDAVFTFGMPDGHMAKYGDFPTVFYDDKENNIIVGAVPGDYKFGYFGYLKKMVLTLHNIVMMKRGYLPFHGALVEILLKNNKKATVLIIGDTATGKSETIEALRIIGVDDIKNMTIIADDMGSLSLDDEGNLIGYGTEIGAFVRLDDLQSGYAFGQVDRAIFMNTQQVNARAILPITTIEEVLRGYPINLILYSNNYEEVDEYHPVISRFDSKKWAISVFRDGTAKSKGTTSTTGIVRNYYANLFGPDQYKEIHDKLASKFFQAAFDKKIFVGQMRTRLGIDGWETKGPEEAAMTLLQKIESL